VVAQTDIKPIMDITAGQISSFITQLRRFGVQPNTLQPFPINPPQTGFKPDAAFYKGFFSTVARLVEFTVPIPLELLRVAAANGTFFTSLMIMELFEKLCSDPGLCV
jgi:hypothetical protein